MDRIKLRITVVTALAVFLLKGADTLHNKQTLH